MTLRLDSIVVLAARLRYPYHQNRLEWCLYPRFTFSQIKWSVVTIVQLDRVRRLGERQWSGIVLVYGILIAPPF